ncbi:MAG: MFS transporter [Anaerolineae bacterium]|nr:MFS transporter [Anaerolineae bacterium]
MIARSRLLFSGTNPFMIGSLFYLFYWAFIAVYDPYLNVYFSELGLTAFQIGLIVTVVPLTSLIWSPFVSAMADRHGKRIQYLQWSLMAWVVMIGVMALPKTFWSILPLVFLMALVRSPTSPISDSLIASMASRHGLSFGRMRMWGSAGFALVSILCGILWTQMGYGPMFATAMLMALPAIFVSGKLESGPTANPQERGPVKELLRDPGMVTLFVISFLMGAALLSTYIFGGIYMRQMGGNEFMMGLMFGLSALVEVPVMHFSGNIINRLTSTHTMALSLAILALSIFGFALASSPEMLIMAGLLKGVGFALYFVTLVRLLDERAPDEWKSTAQAISGACFVGLSPLVTSALFGYIFDTWGGDALYMAATLMAGTAVLLMGLAIFKNWFAPVQERKQAT